jgi:hypothetical protein
VPSTENSLRGSCTVGYWIVVFVILFLFSVDDPFCERTGTRNHLIATAELALALATFDFVVCTSVTMVVKALKTTLKLPWMHAMIAALLVGIGLAYLPFWIYKGYGHFRFEHTWADVSCFFTEANELGFILFVAPPLAVATFLREILIRRLAKPR